MHYPQNKEKIQPPKTLQFEKLTNGPRPVYTFNGAGKNIALKIERNRVVLCDMITVDDEEHPGTPYATVYFDGAFRKKIFLADLEMFNSGHFRFQLEPETGVRAAVASIVDGLRARIPFLRPNK